MAIGRGRIMVRGGKLWLDYDDENGQRRRQSTGLPVGQEKKAEARLREVLALVQTGAEMGIDPRTVTVRRWAEEWIGRREKRGVAMVRDERQRLRLYIGPTLGTLPLADLTTRQVRRWVDSLRARDLSPRTVRHIYSTLRQIMAGAVREDLIPVSPCTLDREDLPKIEDRDPEWRQGAVFTREEIEILVSHPELPLDHRVGYALMGLGGLRWGEVAALRWRAYDTSAEPLGRLTVAVALSDRRRSLERKKGDEDADGIGKTKTGAVRQIPVHPTLASLLAAWRLRSGSQADDLIVAGTEGRPVTQPRAYERMREDLERIGLRPRRLHDFRRAMVSLALAGGASPAVVRWITHTPDRADMMQLYATLPWATLCEAVACMRVGIREGQVVELRQAAGAEPGTPLAHSEAGNQKTPESQRISGAKMVGDAGFEPAKHVPQRSARMNENPAFHATDRVQADLTLRENSAEILAQCAKCARTDPEEVIFAALPSDPAAARALLLRCLTRLG